MLPWLDLGGRLPGLTLECTAPQKNEPLWNPSNVFVK